MEFSQNYQEEGAPVCYDTSFGACLTTLAHCKAEGDGGERFPYLSVLTQVLNGKAY